MHLDAAMFINLARRKDKYWYALGAFHKLDFVKERLIHFVAHDAQDYKTVEDIRSAAVADGFPHFSKMPSDMDLRQFAWIWSYHSALRHIIELDKTILLLTDDFTPARNWGFNRLNALVGELIWYDYGPLRILQLGRSTRRGYKRIEEREHTSMAAKGLSGHLDVAVILTKAGAELVLDVYKEEPHLIPEDVYNRIAQRQECPEIFQGLWHTLDDLYEHAGLEFGSDLVDS